MEDHVNNSAAEGSDSESETALPEDALPRIPCTKGVITAASPELFQYGLKTKPEDVPIELLGECVRISQEVVGINGGVERKGEEEDIGTRDLLCHCTALIRKMLSTKENAPPIDQVIATNIVPLWVDRITYFCNLDREKNTVVSSGEDSTTTALRVTTSEFAQLLLEMTWALTNIACGSPEHTNYVLNINAAVAIMELLKNSGDDNVLEQAAWFVANVAGDSSKARDYILSLGAVEAFLNIHSLHPRYIEVISLRRTIVWALSNLCRGKPAPVVDQVAPIIPVFWQEVHYFYEDTTKGDGDCVKDALWALSYFLERATEEHRGVIARSPLFSWTTLLKILVKENDSSIILPLVRFLGSWATGSDEERRVFFEHDIITPLARFLGNPTRGVRREVCWLLSYLLAGPGRDVKFIIESSSKVVEYLQLICETEIVNDVQKEATWALANASSGADSQDAERLIKREVLESFVTVVQKRADPKIVALALQGIGDLLKSPNPETNADLLYEAKMRIFDADGLDHFERCGQHPSDQVKDRAMDVLEHFFGDFDRSQPQGIDRKWTKGKQQNGGSDDASSDDDHNSDGEGYDL